MPALHRRRLLSLGALAFLASVGVAGAAGLENIILSSAEDAKTSESVFAPDTPKIYLQATITSAVKSASKITVAWVSLDSGGAAPPNYTIASNDYDVGLIDNTLDASLSKPTAGWPAGTYQVRLSVNGVLDQAADFSVK